MKKEFTPDKLIDREAEQEIFEKLLLHEDDARLLTISDQGGQGKSALLKRLHYNCFYWKEMPVCLIELQHREDRGPFQIVEEIRNDFRANFPRLQFKEFDYLNARRMDQEPSAFGVGSGAVQGSIQGTVNAQTATLGGSNNLVAGVGLQNVEKVIINPNSPAVWTPDREEDARNQCVTAFFKDLKVICLEETVVLLLDTWDGCKNDKLRNWILKVLLWQHCFDLENRPGRFVLVLSGREEGFPNFKSILKDRYSTFVRSIESLGEWNEKHVKEFLIVHGYDQVGDLEVQLICAKIKKGWPLETALRFVADYFAN
ncbi:MAG: hypothetical protein ACREEM_17700 [Blastocatellia bacterium]